MGVDEPGVAQPGGAPHRGVVVGRHPDGRARPLHRADVHAHVGEPAAGAVVGHAVLAPQALDQRQILLEALHSLALGHTEGVELHVAVAEADAEDEVAAGDDVEGGDRLGGVDGVVQVEEQDAEPQRHFASLRGEPRQERHALQLLVVALVEVVLAGEDGVPAAVAHGPHHGDLVGERAHHVGVEGLLVGDEQADLHAMLPLPAAQDAPPSRPPA